MTFMFIYNQVKNASRSRMLVDKASATVTSAGQVLAAVVTTGLAIPATSTTTRSEVLGVATEAISAADALTQAGVWETFGHDTFIADTTNNSNAAHNYQFMVLTNSTTVNNTGTHNANGIVQQLAPYGAAADKKIIVRFV